MSKAQNSRQDIGRSHQRGARINLPKGKSQWRIEFSHPVLLAQWKEAGQVGKRPLTIHKLLGTPDRNVALAYCDQMQRIIDDESSWFGLPSDIDPTVERIWKGEWWAEYSDKHFDIVCPLLAKFSLLRSPRGRALRVFSRGPSYHRCNAAQAQAAWRFSGALGAAQGVSRLRGP